MRKRRRKRKQKKKKQRRGADRDWQEEDSVGFRGAGLAAQWCSWTSCYTDHLASPWSNQHEPGCFSCPTLPRVLDWQRRLLVKPIRNRKLQLRGPMSSVAQQKVLRTGVVTDGEKWFLHSRKEVLGLLHLGTFPCDISVFKHPPLSWWAKDKVIKKKNHSVIFPVQPF